MSARGRRLLFAGLAIVLVAGGLGAAWAATRTDHGNPDPGGRILAVLQTVERVLPADAHIVLQQANEPSWDSCDGRPGTFGWNDVSVILRFDTGEQPAALVARADQVLGGMRWLRTSAANTPLGPSATWSRTVGGSTAATATLAPGTDGDSGTRWELDAWAPPAGQRASGC